MDEFGGGGGGGSPVAGLLFLAVYLVFMLGFYLFFCFCAKKICEKSGKDPGIMIWIPIVNLIPLMEVAGMQTWMIVLLFLPIANFVFLIMLMLGLAKARNKNPALAVILGLFCSIVFWPWMAFTD